MHYQQKEELRTRYNELNNNKGKEHKKYICSFPYKNSSKRTNGSNLTFIIGYVFVAITSSGASSSVFSIEKNTR
tara:strand:+ start:267 stop:488 length:222 start_codon:yes stop_codon:yes gene_type:complete